MLQCSVRHIAFFDPIICLFGNEAHANRDLMFQQHPDRTGEVVDARTAAVARPGADDGQAVISVPIAEDHLVVDHARAPLMEVPIIGVFVGHHRDRRWRLRARNGTYDRRHFMRDVGPDEIGWSAEKGSYGGVVGFLAGEDASRIR